MKTILIAALATITQAMPTQDVQMTTKCAPHGIMLATASKEWGEDAYLEGPAMSGTRKMEFLVSRAKAPPTWTIVLTRPSQPGEPDDWSCVIMEGTDLSISSEVPLLGERVRM